MEIEMSTFDKREDAFEKKFAHDEELRFKAMARRNKALALWAAEKLGQTDLDAYLKELIAADLEEGGDEDSAAAAKKAESSGSKGEPADSEADEVAGKLQSVSIAVEASS